MNMPASLAGGHRRLAIVELAARIALAFAIGLAASVVLAGIVLLLAQEAQAAALPGLAGAVIWRAC